MDLIDASSGKTNLEEIVDKAKDWALLNGLAMRPKSEKSASRTDQLEFVPFTLLPSSFPRAEYEEVRSLQSSINKLTHRVAQDVEFLRDSLNETGRVDGFTRRLLEILEVAGGDARSVRLGLLRSDYMLDDDDARRERGRLDLGQVEDASTWTDATSRCKQVEVNTIASGQGWIGTICSRLHRYVLEEMCLTDCLASMPENSPLEGLCSGLYEAWKIYNNPNAAILFVVEDATQHIGDQRFHEYKLRELDPRIHVIRRSLSQLAVTAELDGEDRRLVVDESREIALVYFRSGYAPDQYHSEAEWRARLLLERSRAVKCPSIGYHLAGTKKIQQMLAQPGCLERFLEPSECQRLRRHFTGLYSLDFDEAGEAVVEMALARPDDFVLKPQREGGANNLFGEDLKSKLETMRYEDERTAWILMDKITPVIHKNYMVRSGAELNDRLKDVTSELGIFGVILADGEEILVNETVGHTLRTKLAECDEGGVSSGFGACDSPLLI